MKTSFLRSSLFLIVAVLTALITIAGVPEAAAAPPVHEPPVQPLEAAAETREALLSILNSYQHPITTPSELAQRAFNHGLVMAYGFNRPQALALFKEGLSYDANCAMCYWGIAYALGPSIDTPMMDNAAVPEAYAAIQQAQALAANASPREQAYIQALAQRYSAEPGGDRADLDLAYARAMGEVAGQYPDDPDAATLYAEALMILTPWNHWTKDSRPTEYTAEFVAALEAALRQSPDHLGANHLYIHAVEDSPNPERAIASAGRLEKLAPGAMHLVHKPAHAYWLTDPYHDLYRIDNAAAVGEEKNVDDMPKQFSYPHYSSAPYSPAEMPLAVSIDLDPSGRF
jgi:hypothetical protein